VRGHIRCLTATFGTDGPAYLDTGLAGSRRWNFGAGGGDLGLGGRGLKYRDRTKTSRANKSLRCQDRAGARSVVAHSFGSVCLGIPAQSGNGPQPATTAPPAQHRADGRRAS
jgi:hypothetical protein